MKTRLTAKGRALRSAALKFTGWAMLICLSVAAVTAAIIAVGPHVAALARNLNKVWTRPVANVQPAPAPAPQPVAVTPPQVVSEPVSSPQFIEHRFFRFTWPNNDRRHDVRGQDGRDPRDPRDAAGEREKTKPGKKTDEQSRDRFEKPKPRKPGDKKDNGGNKKDGGKKK